MRSISQAELSSHGPASSEPWVGIDGFVYNIKTFGALHPGGEAVLMSEAGKDATEKFKVAHSAAVMKKYHSKLVVGTLQGHHKQEEYIVHADPQWVQGAPPMWMRPSHGAFQKSVRRFVEDVLLSELDAWKDSAQPPKQVLERLGQEGYLAVLCGSPYPLEYLDADIARKLPADLDPFHEMILIDEIARLGHFGAIAALTNGPAIALSAILKYGSEQQKRAICNEVLMGRKTIALAISEPNAGSDVAGLNCLATPEGENFVLTGNKKWITNGTYADFFVTAVRVAGAGDRHAGLAFFVIPKDAPNFSVRKVNVTGAAVSGTAYLDFLKTPLAKGSLVGKVGQGFQMIMINFLHERLYIATITIRLSRICLEESIKYAMRRIAFGKPLSDLQALRMLIGKSAAEVEKMQAWLESIIGSMLKLGKKADLELAGTVCMLKAECGDLYEAVANAATHVFGGHSLVASGPGGRIEGSVAAVKAYQIPAGATLVMRDFAARQIFKKSKL